MNLTVNRVNTTLTTPLPVATDESMPRTGDGHTSARPAITRLRDRPVVDAGCVPGYGAIFNAGLLRHDGLYHLFARGVRDGYVRNQGPGPRFIDYVSDILVFRSVDGVDYEFAQVLEDGRVLGDGRFLDRLGIYNIVRHLFSS